jgi:hypothetical protein
MMRVSPYSKEMVQQLPPSLDSCSLRSFSFDEGRSTAACYDAGRGYYFAHEDDQEEEEEEPCWGADEEDIGDGGMLNLTPMNDFFTAEDLDVLITLLHSEPTAEDEKRWGSDNEEDATMKGQVRSLSPVPCCNSCASDEDEDLTSEEPKRRKGRRRSASRGGGGGGEEEVDVPEEQGRGGRQQGQEGVMLDHGITTTPRMSPPPPSVGTAGDCCIASISLEEAAELATLRGAEDLESASAVLDVDHIDADDEDDSATAAQIASDADDSPVMVRATGGGLGAPQADVAAAAKATATAQRGKNDPAPADFDPGTASNCNVEPPSWRKDLRPSASAVPDLKVRAPAPIAPAHGQEPEMSTNRNENGRKRTRGGAFSTHRAVRAAYSLRSHGR